MRIENLRKRSVGDRARVEARIVYEDADLPPLEAYYEAEPPLGVALEATADLFATAAFPIALWMGERRIKTEGALDTTLAAGLGEAASLLASWYPRCSSLTLEPADGFHVARPRSEPRAVALFSGGVDAMTMLHENRRLLPLDHPHAIRTVVHAFGFTGKDAPDGVEDPLKRARYEAQHRRIERLGERQGFSVIRVATNLMGLHPRWEPCYRLGFSAVYLAPLIASPGYVSDALIASAGVGRGVRIPHGSHPMLDVLYSTGAVRVNHKQPQLTRNEKLGLIADWEPAYDTLEVCWGNKAPHPAIANCGACEKCVRTMLGLVLLKALPRFKTFVQDDLTPEMIDDIRITAQNRYLNVPDLIPSLERVGRDDLARAIQKQIERLDETRWARQRRKWRGSLEKRLGRRHAPGP